MKTRWLLLAGASLFLISAVTWAQQSSAMQQQLAAVTLKIKGFLQQRKSMNVPPTKGAFEAKFHETNAKCESYLHELEAYSASRGDLKPAFLRILTPEETAILKQELSDVLNKNPCPIGEPTQNPEVAGKENERAANTGSAEQNAQANSTNSHSITQEKRDNAVPVTKQRVNPSNAAAKPQDNGVVSSQGTPAASGFLLTTPLINIDPKADEFSIMVKVKDKDLRKRLTDMKASINVDGKEVPTTWQGESMKATVAKADFAELFANPPASVQLQVLTPGSTSPEFAASIKLGNITGTRLGTQDPKKPVLPDQLNVEFDITQHIDRDSIPGQCSNRAFSHDAQIWQLMMRLRPVTQDARSGAFVYSPANGELYLALFDSFQPLANLQVGARALDGSIVRTVSGELRVIFADRSLTETSDLLNEFQKNPKGILERLKPQLGPLSIYHFQFDPQQDLATVENAIFTWLESQGPVEKWKDAIAKKFNSDNPRALLKTFDNVPVIVGGDGKAVSLQVSALNFAPKNLDDLKNALTNLQNKGIGTKSRSTQSEEATAAKDVLSEQGQTVGTPIIIGDECFQVNIAPDLNSGSSFQPSIRFKARYDYLLPGDSFLFKLRGDGEGSGNSKDFQRIAASIEGMTLTQSTSHSVRWDFGGIARVNHSLKGGVRKDEWQVGGKLQLQMPFVHLPSARASANTKPTIDIEGVAGSVQEPNSKNNVDFLVHANLAYSYRTGRFTVATESQNGWSNKSFFNNRSQFSFGSLELRYNVKDNLDFLGRYECGKKPPDYLKSCGWKSGFDILTGR